MDNHWLRLQQIDQQLASPQAGKALLRPKVGWIRSFRKALGMTIKQLAQRLGVAPSRVVKLETSELDNALTLKSLQTVAEALGCQFVYGFVPKTSLQQQITERAQQIAIQHILRTTHTMTLEDQATSTAWQQLQIQQLTDELLRNNWKHLWDSNDV